MEACYRESVSGLVRLGMGGIGKCGTGLTRERIGHVLCGDSSKRYEAKASTLGC